MKNGKLPSSLLEKLLENTQTASDVIQGPAIGYDAAKVKTFGKNFIIGGDPITFRCENMGKYCVYVNANDITVSGGIPKYFMATILLPTDTEEKEAEILFEQVKSACKELNISLIGGHTEITDCVNRPVISGTMIGEEVYNFQPRNAPINSQILLINKPAIEGTSIIAYWGQEYLKASGISQDRINFALNLINTQGICVMPAGEELFKFDSVYYMHDPTEGGIASALWELSKAIGKGISVNNIEFMDETVEFCQTFGVDPFGLIASGSLLAVLEKGDYAAEKLNAMGYWAKVIGNVTGGMPNVLYKGQPMKTFQRDEIAVFFEKSEEI